MRQLILPMVLGITVMLGACKKNAADQTAEAVPLKTVALSKEASGNDAAVNPDNPYDHIGKQHNIVLDTLRRYTKVTGDTTRKGMNAFMSRYFAEHYGRPLPAFAYPYEKELVKDYKSVLLTQNVSPTAQSFFLAFSDALESIKDLDHYADFKTKIMGIESKILQADLPDKERINLLMTASVFRYSGNYWMTAFNNGDVSFHWPDPILYPDGWLRKIGGVIVGIAADASVIGFSMAWELYDPDIFGLAADMSNICGYYTGWY